MSWLTARQTVLAENVANANTPGYIAKDLKDLDFKSLIGGGKTNSPVQLAATEPGHFAPMQPTNPAPVVQTADDHSLDGNGVSLEEQMMKVSTNAADYSLITTLYKQNISMIKTVLGGGGGG
jgi:flagellar basal-body rod protein FlgB